MARLRITALKAKQANEAITELVGNIAQKSITQNIDLRRELNNVLLSTMNETVVPMDTGYLREHSFVTSDGRLVWSAAYANDVYHGIASNGKPIKNWTTPGTGPYWVDKFIGNTTQMQIFLDSAASYIVEAFEREANTK